MTDDLHPTDEPTHEETLASAFVDGQVTPEEAALVQATPSVHALAMSYLDLRAELADTGSIDPAARDLAVTAALAEFGVLAAAAPAAAPVAPVVQLAARRQWPTRVLATAAAIALVGVAGVVVFGGNSRRSQDDTAVRSSGTVTETQDMAGGAPASTIGAINGSADYALVIDSTQQLHDLPTPPAATPTVAPAASDAVTTTSSAPTDAKTSTAAGHCLTSTQVFLANILYKGSPAIAVRDTVTGVTQAIDEQCKVLVEVSP